MLIKSLKKLGNFKLYVWITAVVVCMTFVQWIMRAILYEKDQSAQVSSEQYDFELESLNSMEKLSSYIDSVSAHEGVGIDQPDDYISLIDNIIRERFYHGESKISFSKNFMAWLAGTLFWDHLSVGVTPDEILGHPKALCSQSAIVFQEIVKEKGFTVRAIGLNRHFCSEVFYEESWHFVDSDKEPIFDQLSPIPSVDELSKNEKLIEKAYMKDSDNVTMAELKDIFNSREILFYHENEFPAKNMRLFQAITKFLSDYLWIFLLIPIALNLVKKKFPRTLESQLQVSEPNVKQAYVEKKGTHTLL